MGNKYSHYKEGCLHVELYYSLDVFGPFYRMQSKYAFCTKHRDIQKFPLNIPRTFEYKECIVRPVSLFLQGWMATQEVSQQSQRKAQGSDFVAEKAT